MALQCVHLVGSRVSYVPLREYDNMDACHSYRWVYFTQARDLATTRCKKATEELKAYKEEVMEYLVTYHRSCSQ